MGSFSKGPVTLGNAEIIRESAAAILVKINDHSGEHWIPKSVIHDDSEVWEEKGSTGKLVVQEWFAEKEGFI